MQGVIAGSSIQSAEAGAEMFRAGGSALDAVLAGVFATSSGDPAITSLAGGGALIHRDGRTGEVVVCDFFASAPGLAGRRGAPAGARGLDPVRRRSPRRTPPLDFEAVEIDFGTTRQTFHIGRGAAAVPGAIPGLAAAWRRWGRLPLPAIVEPSIRFLREGAPLAPFASECIHLLAAILERSPTGRASFFAPTGEPLSEGAIFRNPALADTLERLAESEPEAFYRDAIVPGIVDGFGEHAGGRLTRRDLRRWRAEFRAPLMIAHPRAAIAINPAPSVGGRFIALTLELLEAAGFRGMAADDSLRWELLAAVLRAVAELRDELPDLVDRAEAPQLLRRRVENLLGGAGSPPEPDDGPRPLPGNTVHISAVDADGNAAGVTLSHGEGNGHEIDGTGILMNNFLGEEDLFPRGFHVFTPGERLGTMMAPSVIVGPGAAITVLGTGGSNRIRTALAQVISALLDDELSPEEAVRRPRLHFEGGVLSAEVRGLPRGTAALERARRLARDCVLFDEPSLFFGGVNIAYRLKSGELGGAADSRRGGAVSIVD